MFHSSQFVQEDERSDIFCVGMSLVDYKLVGWFPFTPEGVHHGIPGCFFCWLDEVTISWRYPGSLHLLCICSFQDAELYAGNRGKTQASRLLSAKLSVECVGGGMVFLRMS